MKIVELNKDEAITSLNDIMIEIGKEYKFYVDVELHTGVVKKIHDGQADVFCDVGSGNNYVGTIKNIPLQNFIL